MAEKSIKELEQRIAELTANLNEVTAKANGLGRFAGMLMDELSTRLKQGDATDQKLAGQVTDAFKSFGGSINSATAARLKDV